MTRDNFERMVASIGLTAVPEKFRPLLRNVAFVIEGEPSDEIRRHEGLTDDETLLGLYSGIPQTARGEFYGVGPTLPDTITLYRLPIEQAGDNDPEQIRTVIAETIWHEVAHHFGLDHEEMEGRYPSKRWKSDDDCDTIRWYPFNSIISRDMDEVKMDGEQSTGSEEKKPMEGGECKGEGENCKGEGGGMEEKSE